MHPGCREASNFESKSALQFFLLKLRKTGIWLCSPNDTLMRQPSHILLPGKSRNQRLTAHQGLSRFNVRPNTTTPGAIQRRCQDPIRSHVAEKMSTGTDTQVLATTRKVVGMPLIEVLKEVCLLSCQWLGDYLNAKTS